LCVVGSKQSSFEGFHGLVGWEELVPVTNVIGEEARVIEVCDGRSDCGGFADGIRDLFKV
jgi:hypothetical protein